MERKAFTINIPSEDHIKEADYFGLVSGKREDKFAVTGLTPVKGEHVDAPWIKEFPLVLECSLLKVVEIGLHTQFIGEVKDLKADESELNEQGSPEIKLVRPFSFTPESRATTERGRFSARPFR